MNLVYRPARREDIPQLVAMLADDHLGASREGDPANPNREYLEAFDAIARDPNNLLAVVEHGNELVGMLQLTFIPYLSHTGTWRCLIEGVRIAASFRGRGLGSTLLQWAIARARERHCGMVQLTSDKRRPDAIRFYESLGFRATHEGFKLRLEESTPGPKQ